MTTEYNKYREKFISDLKEGAYSVLPAYYYYINHCPTKEILGYTDFYNLFFIGLEGEFNLISQEVTAPVYEYSDIQRILIDYYSVQMLYDKENNLIKVF